VSRLFPEGVYYLYLMGPDGPEYASVLLDDGRYLYAFSNQDAARALAERLGAEVGYFPTPADLFYGLPPGTRGFLLDYDPVAGEGYRVRREELG